MNDERFIELLNLYIDGELSRRDVAELEEEILTNPERRRIYGEYCRIHRATRDYFETFRSGAETGSAGLIRALREAVGASPEREIASSAGIPANWITWGTGLAAACMVAFVGVRLVQVKRQSAHEPANLETATVVVEKQTKDVQMAYAAPLSVAAAQAETTGPTDPTADPFAQPESQAKVVPARDPFSHGPVVAEELPRDESRESGMFVEEFNAGFEKFPKFELNQVDFRRESPLIQPRVFRSRRGGSAFEMEPVGYRIHR